VELWLINSKELQKCKKLNNSEQWYISYNTINMMNNKFL
jgi:hypothetical protein